jgi:uncharacterized protein (TIGR00251 family)
MGRAERVTDLDVRLQPRAARDEVVGVRDDQVVIRVKAPPVDGKANAALISFIAKRAGVPKSSVSIVRGHTSRDKVVRVEGIEAPELRTAIGLGNAG